MSVLYDPIDVNDVNDVHDVHDYVHGANDYAHGANDYAHDGFDPLASYYPKLSFLNPLSQFTTYSSLILDSQISSKTSFSSPRTYSINQPIALKISATIQDYYALHVQDFHSQLMKSSDELSRDVIMDGTPIHADDVHLLIFVQQIKISRYSLLCLIHGCAQYFHQNVLLYQCDDVQMPTSSRVVLAGFNLMKLR